MHGEARGVSAQLLADKEFIAACAVRDFSRIFAMARRSGIYPSRIARQCDLTTGRVGDVIAGRRGIGQIDVVERIADGLRIPGQMLGLADRAWEVETRRTVPEPDVAATMGGDQAGRPPVATDVAGLLDGSVHSLWEGDEAVQRRQFLEASAAVVGWVASAPPVPQSGRIDRHAVDRLVRRSARLRQLDNYLGGAQTFPLYAAEVESSVRVLQQTSYSEEVGRSLLSLVAEQAQQAGWAAFDAGMHSQATRLYSTSLKAAQQADNPALTGNAYAFLAYQQTALGQRGVELALASCRDVADARMPATVRTLLYERVAWAYAVAGEVTDAERFLAEAEEAVRDASAAEQSPDWAAWVDTTEVQIMTGRVWAVLHKPLRAVPALEQALAHFDDAHARDKALYLSWLADAYIDAEEIEQGAAITQRCMELSSDVASVRPKLRTAALCKRLEPYRSLPSVAETLERAGR